jgi:hypothetical protein
MDESMDESHLCKGVIHHPTNLPGVDLGSPQALGVVDLEQSRQHRQANQCLNPVVELAARPWACMSLT